MASLILKGIDDDLKNGFKAASATLGETMGDMMEYYLRAGKDYSNMFNHVKLLLLVEDHAVESMLKKMVDRAEREDFKEGLYNALSFLEMRYFSLMCTTAKARKFSDELSRISGVKALLLPKIIRYNME